MFACFIRFVGILNPILSEILFCMQRHLFHKVHVSSLIQAHKKPQMINFLHHFWPCSIGWPYRFTKKRKRETVGILLLLTLVRNQFIFLVLNGCIVCCLYILFFFIIRCCEGGLCYNLYKFFSYITDVHGSKGHKFNAETQRTKVNASHKAMFVLMCFASTCWDVGGNIVYSWCR